MQGALFLPWRANTVLPLHRQADAPLPVTSSDNAGRSFAWQPGAPALPRAPTAQSSPSCLCTMYSAEVPSHPPPNYLTPELVSNASPPPPPQKFLILSQGCVGGN